MPTDDISATVEAFSRSESFFGVTVLSDVSLGCTQTLRSIAESASQKYILLYTKDMLLQMGLCSLDRFVAVAEDTGADMLYSDRYELDALSDAPVRHPAIDCQKGALRDDFDIGPVLVFRTSSFRKAELCTI